MDSYDRLWSRLRTDPINHLGRKSPCLIGPYEIGYELALQRWEKPPLKDPVNWAAMQNWAEHHFGWTADMGCRQNLVGFSMLTSIDEASAFDRFFELDNAARQELRAIPAPGQEHFTYTDDPRLVEFIRSERFRSRPGMFLGGPRLDGLRAICNGYVWAERDLGVQGSAEQQMLTGFQHWMESRYPFAKACPWERTIDFLALHSNERAWAAFYDLFGMYCAGRNPDALSPAGERIIANITNAVMANDPSADPAGVSATFAPVVKGICPT